MESGGLEGASSAVNNSKENTSTNQHAESAVFEKQEQDRSTSTEASYIGEIDEIRMTSSPSPSDDGETGQEGVRSEPSPAVVESTGNIQEERNEQSNDHPSPSEPQPQAMNPETPPPPVFVETSKDRETKPEKQQQQMPSSQQHKSNEKSAKVSTTKKGLPRVATIPKSVKKAQPSTTKADSPTKKLTGLPRVATIQKGKPAAGVEKQQQASKVGSKPKHTGLPRVALLTPRKEKDDAAKSTGPGPHYAAPKKSSIPVRHVPMSRKEKEKIDLLECKKQFKAHPAPVFSSNTAAPSSHEQHHSPRQVTRPGPTHDYQRPTVSSLAKTKAPCQHIGHVSPPGAKSKPSPHSNKGTKKGPASLQAQLGGKPDEKGAKIDARDEHDVALDEILETSFDSKDGMAKDSDDDGDVLDNHLADTVTTTTPTGKNTAVDEGSPTDVQTLNLDAKQKVSSSSVEPTKLEFDEAHSSSLPVDEGSV